jgi:O-antigen ligase
MVRSVFPVVVFFLAAIFSGIWEKMPFLADFHVLMILGAVALIMVGLSGRLVVVLNNPIGRSLAYFTAWAVVCVPFAVWPGGSFALLRDIWSRSALTFLLVAGCVLTIDQSRTIFKTIGYSVGVLAILALVLRGVDKTGRLGLLGTRYENANNLAWTLIVGLCFLVFLYVRGRRLQKFIVVIFAIAILLALVKTGSRAGMIGIGMFVLYGFMQSKPATRIKLAITIPIVLAVLYASAPPEVRTRYTTFFASGEDSRIGDIYLAGEDRARASAAASAENRWKLLRDGIYLTLKHPVFGVGPGDFMVAQNDLALARGEFRGAWRVTHNTYIQISSEMGIPGLILYIVLLYQCFKPLNLIARSQYPGKEGSDLRELARSLRATFVVLVTVITFGSFGYDTNIPMMAGLACALSLMAQRYLASLAVPLQVTPTPAVLAEPALEPAWTSFQ